MTRDQTLSLLAHMAVAWPSISLHPEGVELWIQHTDDLDVGLARKAFDQLVGSEEFPPTVARFRSTVAALRPKNTGPLLPLPRLPWPVTKAALDDAREQLRRSLAGRRVE